jgi:hypothetical protein
MLVVVAGLCTSAAAVQNKNPLLWWHDDQRAQSCALSVLVKVKIHSYGGGEDALGLITPLVVPVTTGLSFIVRQHAQESSLCAPYHGGGEDAFGLLTHSCCDVDRSVSASPLTRSSHCLLVVVESFSWHAAAY